MSKTTIVQDVLDVFRAAGFEVRVSEFGDKPETIIYGTSDNAGVLMESVLEHFGKATEGADSCAQREKCEVKNLAHAGVTAEPAAPVTTKQPKPSFFVIVGQDGIAEFVTNHHHAAQEHINDACVDGVEGAGKWKAVPVFEMRPTDDHLWEQTLRDRDTYHEWADKLAEAIAKHFDAYIGEHSNMNCPWAEAMEVIEAAPVQADQAQIRDQALEEAALAAEKVREACSERDSRKWPELRDDAATGAGECADAIRALRTQSTATSNDTGALGEKGADRAD